MADKGILSLVLWLVRSRTDSTSAEACQYEGGVQRKLLFVCIVVLSIFLTQSAGAASFQGIGDLTGGEFASYACAVSADGRIVVGMSNAALGEEAFSWTTGGGMVGLSNLHGGVKGYQSQVYDVSAHC